MTHVVMVKKVLRNGAPCRKCIDVLNRLQQSSLLDRIDQIVTATEGEPESEGYQLATLHGVDSAPFFIITDEQGEQQIYTSYLRFMREIRR